MSLYGLIMAGGAGSRLWPRSRRRLPKQFLPLLSSRTMLQETADRITPIMDAKTIMVVTGREYVDLAVAQLPHVPLGNIIAEPSGKGTAPAIGLGAVEILRRDPQATMAVLSADHMIRRAHSFRMALKAAEAVAQQGYLVTLGITPDQPHTGYGYIHRGAPIGQHYGFEVFEVDRFVEKPDLPTAQQYLTSEGYSWNAGIFVWRVDVILEQIGQHLPDLREQLDAIVAAGGPGLPDAFAEVWGDVSNTTIDYGVLECASKVAIIPVDIGWSDVGDWNTLAELKGGRNGENVIDANYIGVDTHGSLIYSDSDRLIATVGLDNFIVIDTGDALLIAPRDRAQDVKRLVDELRTHGRDEVM